MRERITKEVLAEQWLLAIHDLHRSLAAAYRASDLTYAEIGEKIGRSAGEVEDHVRGRRKPDLRRWHEIARAMGCRFQARIETID